jgi:methionine salvage enolase-phosphatase E1
MVLLIILKLIYQKNVLKPNNLLALAKKKDIILTKDSVLSLMQEIYNELVEQRTTAIRIQNKLIGMMKEPKDTVAISNMLKEQQKIINDTIEKKLSLSKLQSTIWEKSQNSGNEEMFDLSEMDEDVLKALIDKDIDNSSAGGYKLNK